MKLFNCFKKKKREIRSEKIMNDENVYNQMSWLKQKWAMNNITSRSNTSYCFLLVAKLFNYTQDEIEVLKKIAQNHGDTVEIYEGQTLRYSEERFKEVVSILRKEGLIAQGYDYAWFRWLIQHECLIVNQHLKTKSDKEYCSYLKSIGLDDVPDRSVINRYYRVMDCNNRPYVPPFMFSDCINYALERERRNNLIVRFMELMQV